MTHKFQATREVAAIIEAGAAITGEKTDFINVCIALAGPGLVQEAIAAANDAGQPLSPRAAAAVAAMRALQN